MKKPFDIPVKNVNDNLSGSGFTATTHISEDELLEAGGNSVFWDEISSVLPYDNSLFFKWGGDIGDPIELSFSFIGADFIDYNEAYYDVDKDGIFDPTLSAAVSFMRETNGAMPIDFSDAEKEIVRKTLDEWAGVSGLKFVEVNDTLESYGEIRLGKLDFSTWSAFDEVYDGSAGFAYHPLGGDG